MMPLQKIVKVGLSGRAEGAATLKFAEKPAGMRGLSGEVGMILSAGVGRRGPDSWFGSALTLPPASVGDLPLDLEINKASLTSRSSRSPVATSSSPARGPSPLLGGAHRGVWTSPSIYAPRRSLSRRRRARTC